MNGPLKFLIARKILPLLDLLAKFERVLACSCSPNFCVARKLAKQFFYLCSCSQKNRSARHARECSQGPFVTPRRISTARDRLTKCFCVTQGAGLLFYASCFPFLSVLPFYIVRSPCFILSP